MIVQHTLQELLNDAYAFCWNHMYSGWEYRVKGEGHDAVAKDCDAAAKEFVNQLKQHLKEPDDTNTPD